MKKINGDVSVSEQKLQLKVGNYYKRRDGEIVGPVDLSGCAHYRYEIPEGGSYADNGEYILDGINRPSDLIEDLGPTDPRTVEPKTISPEKLQIAKKALAELNEPAKPKKRPLAVGDRVMTYRFPYKERATVKEIHSKEHIVVLTDKNNFISINPQQCKRLKPKAKNVFSGKTDAGIRAHIAAAWNEILSEGATLTGLIKKLGLGE